MPVAGGPKITTTGILLEVDAANASSYTSGSSTWVNVFRPGTRNGTINGTVGFSPTDAYGALTFPGTTSSYVDFGNIGDLSVSWSFQVAVKPAPSSSGNYTILSYASGSNTGSWTYKLDYSSSNQSAVLSVYSATGSTQVVYRVTGSVPTGSWSIVNASYGNTIIGMYVNGQPTDYVLTTGSTVGYNTSNRLYLGGTFGTTSSYYTGSMASFFSYNTDVPNTQLVQNYNAYATRFGLPPSVLFPSSVDPDAFRFIEVAQITDSVQAAAVSSLVVGLKSNNLWDKMQAIYPFVGGTAYSHKFNLKDPRDSDAAFRIQFFGAVTHSNLGISASAAGYGDTRFVPTASFVNISSSIHVAINISSRPVVANDPYVAFIGDYEAFGFGSTALCIGTTDTTTPITISNVAYGTSPVNFTISSLGGLYISTRITSTGIQGYKRSPTQNINQSTSVTFTKTSTNTNTIRLFRGYVTNNYTTGVLYQYASIGTGLTQTDADNLSTLLTAFNNTLGRS
jgi:hypothetical protein